MSKPSKTPARKDAKTFGKKASHAANALHAGGLHPHETPVRKNHYLYQSKIDLAKKILGATTETEALDAALDILIYGEALAQGTESMAGEEYNDVLGIASEIPGSDKVG